MTRGVAFLANNGDIGGGEVMLLEQAEAARSAGLPVRVVAPATPGDCAERAEALGLPVTRIEGRTRVDYLRGLRRWARGRTDLLWCNGLLPATATALLRGVPRVVHLHRLPTGRQPWVARLARIGARATVVPSRFLQSHLPGALVVPNWTRPIEPTTKEPAVAEAPVTVGFLGRVTEEKGVLTLLDALDTVCTAPTDREIRLLLAGESRFVDDEETARVEERIAASRVPVERAGWIALEEFFSRVDLVIVPSVAQESFGLTAAETMAAAVPLIVSDAGALPEVVGPGHPYVFPAGDPDRLAELIRRTMTGPEATRSSIRAGRARWETHFSPAAGRAGFVTALTTLMKESAT